MSAVSAPVLRRWRIDGLGSLKNSKHQFVKMIKPANKIMVTLTNAASFLKIIVENFKKIKNKRNELKILIMLIK